MLLTSDGIDLDPWIHAFYEGLLRGALQAWPVWVALALLALGAIAVGIVRRAFRTSSPTANPRRARRR